MDIKKNYMVTLESVLGIHNLEYLYKRISFMWMKMSHIKILQVLT